MWWQKLWEQIETCLIAKDRWKLILEGVGNTIIIALGAILIGTVIGAVLALMRVSQSRLLRGISTVYITVIRGVPVVTQLLIFSFVVFAPLGWNKLHIAVVAFGINSGAYCCEIFRAGIQGVNAGQMEAGRSLGLSKAQTMLSIIVPQAFRAVLPTYTNEFVVLVKETSVAGYIAIRDLTKVGDAIRNATYNAWVPLFAVAIIYLIMTLGLSRLFAVLERRLARSDRG
ncbi:MAG: amino acid ABC transporter permease [Oscillospiraceae bacterium]|nr:amino acid ABC transporter permease [Oscillospiraceae bacterium]